MNTASITHKIKEVSFPLSIYVDSFSKRNISVLVHAYAFYKEDATFDSGGDVWIYYDKVMRGNTDITQVCIESSNADMDIYEQTLDNADLFYAADAKPVGYKVSQKTEQIRIVHNYIEDNAVKQSILLFEFDYRKYTVKGNFDHEFRETDRGIRINGVQIPLDHPCYLDLYSSASEIAMIESYENHNLDYYNRLVNNIHQDIIKNDLIKELNKKSQFFGGTEDIKQIGTKGK